MATLQTTPSERVNQPNALSARGFSRCPSVFVISRLKGQRVLALAAVLVNGVIGLLAQMVVGMDSSGDWL
jgi:hypothetical protein